MIYITGHIYPTTDLDSVISSILLSDFITKVYNKKAKPIFLGKTKDKNIVRILKHLKVDFPKKYKIKENDEFILVDHNNKNQSIGYFNLKNNVFGVVDHHKDEGIIPNHFKIIKKMGSTATLIFDLYKKNNIKITKQLARLFLYAIISDTVYFNIDACRQKDKQVVEELYKMYNLESKEKVFLFIENLKEQDKLSLDKLINQNKKLYKIKKYAVEIPTISITSKRDILDDLNNHNFNKKYDLVCMVIYYLDKMTTNVYYFGKLAKYFKNKKYNRIVSRKAKVLIDIESKIDTVNSTKRK